MKTLDAVILFKINKKDKAAMQKLANQADDKLGTWARKQLLKVMRTQKGPKNG